MAQSKIRRKLKRETAHFERSRSPGQRIFEAMSFIPQARSLFIAGLLTSGFSKKEAIDIWNKRHEKSI